MSLVSVLPPHPPMMSAARKLALALAESAQKASCGSRRRSMHPQERPPRPSVLDLKVYPQEYYSTRVWQTSEHSGPHPVCSIPTQLNAEQVSDGQESMCNFTPNVSPLGSGSLEEGSAGIREYKKEEEQRITDMSQTERTYQSVGVSTPVQPVCSAQSPLTSPIYVNTDSINVFNFRAVLAETSIPASLDEVLPRPLQTSSACHYNPVEDRPPGPVKDVYSNHHHPRHAGRLPAPRCPWPDAMSHHLSRPKQVHRQSSESHYSTLGFKQPLSSQSQRRHRGEHLIRGCQRQQDQWHRSRDKMVGHPAIRRAHSFHAPPITHYQSAEKEILPPDSMFYFEPTSREEVTFQKSLQTGVRPQFENISIQPIHYNPNSNMNPEDGSRHFTEPFQQSDVPYTQTEGTRQGGQYDTYNYSPKYVPPVKKELYIASRNMVVYEARDKGIFERVVYQPVVQEKKCRRGTALSPCESPISPTDSTGKDTMHTRSKSDPGNVCLLASDRKENQNVSIAASPRSQLAELSGTRQQVTGHWSQVEPRLYKWMQLKESAAQHPPLCKVPSPPERGCTDLRNSDNNQRSRTQGHEQTRFVTANVVNSGPSKPGILRRSGRSQSTRESRHGYHYPTKSPVDPEHLGSFSNRRTQSTKVRPTQYDPMLGYYAAPKHKPTRSIKAATGYLPDQGSVTPHGHRLLSKALGQDSLYHPAQ